MGCPGEANPTRKGLILLHSPCGFQCIFTQRPRSLFDVSLKTSLPSIVGFCLMAELFVNTKNPHVSCMMVKHLLSRWRQRTNHFEPCHGKLTALKRASSHGKISRKTIGERTLKLLCVIRRKLFTCCQLWGLDMGGDNVHHMADFYWSQTLIPIDGFFKLVPLIATETPNARYHTLTVSEHKTK